MKFKLNQLKVIFYFHLSTEDSSNIPIILVGNKCDEENTREVSQEYVKDIINKQMKNCAFMETSAKTNSNVKEAFQV